MTKTLNKDLPTTWSEIIKTNAPFIRYKEKVIATKHWPDKDCSLCYGLGYTGNLINKPSEYLKGKNRNQLCPCGTLNSQGKRLKFKHCCMKRTKEYASKQNTLLLCKCVELGQIVDSQSTGLKEMKQELQDV